MNTKQSGVRPIIECEETMTKQSHKDECDVNFIMAKYQKTGIMEFREKRMPEFMDCMEVDFQTAMQIVKEGEEVFADLPSSIRKEFNNDPGAFMDFVHNPENGQALVDLGLAHPSDVELTEPEPTPPTEAETA